MKILRLNTTKHNHNSDTKLTGTSRIVPCPTCEQPTKWSSGNRFRPFCSERCKLIDFGSWANEEHRIVGTEAQDEASSDEPLE
ncbi:MAG: DNA gyrase inhibitor YacG [Pseudomonadales bacterium]|nr:DNA gyrase inhibitor YacG [Pseudomonadales bacterium]